MIIISKVITFLRNPSTLFLIVCATEIRHTKRVKTVLDQSPGAALNKVFACNKRCVGKSGFMSKVGVRL